MHGASADRYRYLMFRLTLLRGKSLAPLLQSFDVSPCSGKLPVGFCLFFAGAFARAQCCRCPTLGVGTVTVNLR